MPTTKCTRCGTELSDIMTYCWACGKNQKAERTAKQRGNGQGTVYKLKNGKYRAVVTVGYYVDEVGKMHRKTRSKNFPLKKDAIAALPNLAAESEKKQKKTITFQQLYEKWAPTHSAGKSTMDCYKAAMKHFRPVWLMSMQDIDIDDLQDCVDSCGKGKRTQQNMKALCGLLYKYGIPRQCIPENLNLAQFLRVSGEGAAHRESFTDVQIEMIRRQIGKMPMAEYVYCLIYLGFRPSEFLSLDCSQYDAGRGCFVGGAKTPAGIDRVVTISPKIQPYIDQIFSGRTNGAFFCDRNGQAYNLRAFTDSVFYPVLEAAGIDNPIVEIAGGVKRHKYSPHSCRHTFTTLMKRVNAPSKDKLELIGHTSEEMLRYYQDVDISDLRKITDVL